MSKLLLLLLLVLSQLFCGSPKSAPQVSFQYVTQADDTVMIIGMDGPDAVSANGTLTIPAEFDGKPVTSISGDAFRSVVGLRSVNLPDSLHTIERYAFANNKDLQAITLPEGLTTLGEGVFFDCGLKTIYLPASLTTLGENPFGDNVELVEITVHPENPVLQLVDGALQWRETLVCYPPKRVEDSYVVPQGVRKIDAYAFAFSELRSIELPESVSWIGGNAFSYCASLQEVNLPGNLIRMDNNPFSTCPQLDKLNISESQQRFVLQDGLLIDTEQQRLIAGIEMLLPEEVKVPEGIVEIGNDAFFQCGGLRSILLPDSLKTIGSYAFAYTGLTELVLPEGVESLRGMALLNCEALTAVTLPQSLTSIGTIHPSRTIYYVSAGSFAEEYVQENHLTYEVMKDAP